MKLKNAPTCGAVLRYHTWFNFTRPENHTASNYYKNRLADIGTSNQLFNARLQLIDQGISILNDVLDPDLRHVLTPEGYKSTVNIMKSKGIVASLAAGQTPFKLNTLKGKVLNKAFKDKIITEGGSKTLCNPFFEGTVADSCGNEAAKVTACALDLASKGWKGAATCVSGGITTYIGLLNNALSIGEIVSIRQHNNGYLLINDYLNAYYAKGSAVTSIDDVRLENDIQVLVNKWSLRTSGFGDYDIQFVKDGIRDGLIRTAVTASNNVKLK